MRMRMFPHGLKLFCLSALKEAKGAQARIAGRLKTVLHSYTGHRQDCLSTEDA